MKLKQALKSPDAFTLIELLLGLAIAAIIGVSIYNIFWSATRLDDRMRRAHENYLELLMADQALTHDLENAINLDFSGSYPDAVIFDGKKGEFSFLTQTPKGIKRVRYFCGLSGQESLNQRMTGRVVNPLSKEAIEKNPKESVTFLLRQESSLADWLNETANDTSVQITAAGIKKGSFNCQYAPSVKDLHSGGSNAIVYSDAWDEKGLPLAVSCSFILYDPRKPGGGLLFKRDIYLAPVEGYHNEQ